MLIQSLRPQIFNGFKSKAECKRVILESTGIKLSAAFGRTESNPKVYKNMKQGVSTIPHNLAPHKSGGFNTCAQASLGCIKACLNTAGNPVYLKGKLKARHNRTQAFYRARKAYIALMAFEIQSHVRKAESLGYKAAVRLNTTSDIQWESVYFDNGKTLFDLFPAVSFYDYTKIQKRLLGKAMPSNYHLTFSKSESNDTSVDAVLANGGNVAIVFDKLPDTYKGFPVINGDLTDYRPSDKRGVIVGLKAKGEAKVDQSGFVVHINEKESV